MEEQKIRRNNIIYLDNVKIDTNEIIDLEQKILTLNYCQVKK